MPAMNSVVDLLLDERNFTLCLPIKEVLNK
jgi:hypothetical protein